MFAPELDMPISVAVDLLIHYSFDLGGYPAKELVERWLTQYPGIWIAQGVIEALYQGRYKAVSVEQILSYWQRRGEAMYHYSYEFERLVCSFPQSLNSKIPAPKFFTLNNYNQKKDELEINQVSADNETKLNQQTPQMFRNDKGCAIAQFIPPSNDSGFYHKLKAISRTSEELIDSTQN